MLPQGVSVQDPVPVIVVGPGRTLILKNLTLVHSASLPACLQLAAGGPPRPAADPAGSGAAAVLAGDFVCMFAVLVRDADRAACCTSCSCTCPTCLPPGVSMTWEHRTSLSTLPGQAGRHAEDDGLLGVQVRSCWHVPRMACAWWSMEMMLHTLCPRGGTLAHGGLQLAHFRLN